MIMLSLACGGAGGYLLRAHRTNGASVLSLKDVVREEYFAPPDSFSRITNTRNTLDALSERLGFGILDVVVAYRRLPKHTELERRKAEQLLEHAIQAAETGMQEFEGTEQQLEVVRSLLFALQEAGRFDRWTEVYLKVLHEHPTHPLVAHLANEAVKLSRLSGQQGRVLQALSNLNAFEPAFTGRAEIEAAISSAHPCFSQVQGFGCVDGLAQQNLPE